MKVNQLIPNNCKNKFYLLCWHYTRLQRRNTDWKRRQRPHRRSEFHACCRHCPLALGHCHCRWCLCWLGDRNSTPNPDDSFVFRRRGSRRRHFYQCNLSATPGQDSCRSHLWLHHSAITLFLDFNGEFHDLSTRISPNAKKIPLEIKFSISKRN